MNIELLKDAKQIRREWGFAIRDCVELAADSLRSEADEKRHELEESFQ